MSTLRVELIALFGKGATRKTEREEYKEKAHLMLRDEVAGVCGAAAECMASHSMKSNNRVDDLH
jgi:phosphatidylglycerophosphatase A